MDWKKLVSVMAIILTVLSMAVITVAPVEAVEPEYPARWYIQDITAAGPPYRNFDTGGVRVLLTAEGDRVGMNYDAAYSLSYWVITSWERQAGQSWPYGWRSRDSVAREIQVHCYLTDTTTRRMTISFNGW